MDKIYSSQIQSVLIQKLRDSANNCGVLDQCIKAKIIHWSYEMNIFMYADNTTYHSQEEARKNQILQKFCELLHVFANESPHHRIEISIEDYIDAIRSDCVKFLLCWISGDNLDQITYYIISTFYNAINKY